MSKCATIRPAKCRAAAAPGSLYCAACNARRAEQATRYAAVVTAMAPGASASPHGPATGRGLCTREHPCGDCDVCAFIAGRDRR